MAGDVVRAYLGLGANIGNRAANMRLALRLLADAGEVAAVSSLYRSEAMVPEGAPPGPDYLNAVCALDTRLAPEELLAACKEIERRIGRRPGARWSPRPIDIDVLLYGGAVIATDTLTVPHPGIAARAFVQAPLREIAPDAVHPSLGRIGDVAMPEGVAEWVAGPEWAVDG
jgi:2-amino-4-hydroxy-6-hydroxymethyldihydropteridine diphosphokinase